LRRRGTANDYHHRVFHDRSSRVRRAAGKDQQHYDHHSVSQRHRNEHDAHLFERGNESVSRDGSVACPRRDGAAAGRTSSAGCSGASPHPDNHFFKLGKRDHSAEENYNICRRFGTEADHDYVEWGGRRTVSEHHDHYDESILIKTVKEAAGDRDRLEGFARRTFEDR
jgi:hypothetical protein